MLTLLIAVAVAQFACVNNCADQLTLSPFSLNQFYPGLPAGAPDAVFERISNAKIYFFYGTNYYRFSNPVITGAPASLDLGYPKDIATNWFGLPDGTSGVNAVFQRKSSGDIYFFIGSQYYKFQDKYLTGAVNDTVVAGYPKDISANWGGLPSPVNAAFQRDNLKIYFFVGTEYYRFTDKLVFGLASDQIDAGYPVATSSKWTGLPTGAVPDAVVQAFYGNQTVWFFVGTSLYSAYDKDVFGCPNPTPTESAIPSSSAALAAAVGTPAPGCGYSCQVGVGVGVGVGIPVAIVLTAILAYCLCGRRAAPKAAAPAAAAPAATPAQPAASTSSDYSSYTDDYSTYS